MSQSKKRKNKIPIADYFDQNDSIPAYDYRDEDVERRIAKIERNIIREDSADENEGNFYE